MCSWTGADLRAVVGGIGLRIFWVLSIPPGSFQQLGQSGNWTFSGLVGNAAVTTRIDALPTGVYQLRLEASNVDTNALSNPVTVKLTVGSSFGSAAVNPTLLNPNASH